MQGGPDRVPARMTSPQLRRRALVAILALGVGLGAPACSGGEGSGPARAGVATTGGLGGYAPVSDVASVAALSRDVAAIAALVTTRGPDVAAIEAIYADGRNAVGDDGSVRTLRALATAARDEPLWNDAVAFFGERTWLDTFVAEALAGTGAFAGASDAVRGRAIRSGIRDGVMVASVLHELIAAEQEVAAGATDAADGAPHHVDAAWALYRGDEPSGAPFATAAEAGAASGTGGAVNAAVRARMTAARRAAEAGDAAALKAADDEVVRQILIAYLQATLTSASAVERALARGDAAGARAEQAEGLARYRVIAPLVARVDEPDARAVLDAFDITTGPVEGMARVVTAALRSAYGGLGIERAEIGTPGGSAGRGASGPAPG